MRTILTAAISVLMLSGCVAQWKTPAYDPAERTALEGFPGVTCQQMKNASGHPIDKPLCLNQSQWAARDNPLRISGGYGPTHPAPLYPNFATAQVASSGTPPPGPAWNPNP